MGKGWVLAAAVVGSAMISIDASAVNVSLPVIQRELQATSAQMLWVIEGYALFLSALLLAGGALGDAFGRRLLFGCGLALFMLASAACALAADAPLLILARCVQGIGGALALPQSLALLSAAYTGDERGRAIGTWSSFAALTGAAGPLLGGFLAEHASWRWVFLINLPLAAVVLAILRWRVPADGERAAAARLDVTGALLATLGLGALVGGLIGLGGRHDDPAALAAVAGGVATLALFAVTQARARAPMLPLGLFRVRLFAVANLYTLILYAALGGSLYFVPFAMIDVQRYAPTAAGAVMLPFVAITALFARASGGLIPRFGVRLPLVGGAMLAACGYAAFARPGIGEPYWSSYLPAATLLGLAGLLFITPLTTTVFDASDPQRSGIASAVNNAVARTAGLLAVALFGIVMATAFERDFERRLARAPVSGETRRIARDERARFVAGSVPADVAAPDRPAAEAAVRGAYLTGFRTVMLTAAALCMLAAGVALIALPRPARGGRTGFPREGALPR